MFVVIEGFDLNKVEGHKDYEYLFLLDRIEKIMEEKHNEDPEASGSIKSDLPISRFLSTTKTTWNNFEAICL